MEKARLAFQGLSGSNFVSSFVQNKDLVIFTGLLNRVFGACTDKVIDSWSCDRCSAALKPDEFVQIYTDNRNNKAVVCRFDSVLFLCIRGSKTAANWEADAEFSLSGIPQEFGCPTEAEAHHGFLVNWQSLADPVVGAMKKLRASKVVCCGHSLGGAEALLAALYLQRDFEVLGAITFESPRTFSATGARCYESKHIPTLRVTNPHDPIVRLPPGIWGYEHVGDELYLDPHGFVHCAPNNLSKCSDKDDFWIASRHCDTLQALTFDFCQCNDKDGWVRDLKILQWVVFVLFVGGMFAVLGGVVYLVLRGKRPAKSADFSLPSQD